MRNDLEDSKRSSKSNFINDMDSNSLIRSNEHYESGTRRFFRNFLIITFVVVFGIYTIQAFEDDTPTLPDIESVSSALSNSRYSSSLLDGMGKMMAEIGYADLSTEELIDLRNHGVTATFATRMYNIGYRNLTVDELKKLGENNVTETFASMMKELGYNLTVDDLVELKIGKVTAHFTSNLHDLGYTNITKDELLRLRSVGITIDMVKKYIRDNQAIVLPTVEELIRYRISNQ